jgi:uncharacterized protein (DUF1800 family)
MRARVFRLGVVIALLIAGWAFSAALAQPPDLQAAVQKAKNDVTAAEKAVADAKVALSAAQKDLAEKTAAAKAAGETLAAAKAKAETANAAEKPDAEKGLAAAKANCEKTAAARTAAEKTFASRTTALRESETRLATASGALRRANREIGLKEIADAQTFVIKAEQEKIAAEKAIEQKVSAVNSARAAFSSAKMEAQKADADAAMAKARLDKATGDKRAVAEKSFDEKSAVAKAAGQKVATAQANLDKAIAEKDASEHAVTEKETAIRAAMAKAAVVRANADGGLKPIAESGWDYAKARHLLYRAGFGGTPDEVNRLVAMGPHRAVEYLVYYHRRPAPDIPFAAVMRERPQPFERQLAAAERIILEQRRQQREGEQIQGMRTWWVRRMVESPRPLEEKLTLFWHGHFACEYQTLENSHFMFQQNQMFREHATGNFGALLQGLVHDATMLRYLNNDTNVKGHPNENLAREIMELFSLGLDQGYTEADIREAAKALAGYSYDPRTGQSRFIMDRHETGAKTIFGKTGDYTGDSLVDLILQQPHTARFIAKKLFTFFAYENPNAEAVEKLAKELRVNNYELAPMLQNLFLSEDFYSSQAMGTQIKSPVQLMVGALRELGIKDANYVQITHSLRNMGQDLFQPPNVKGWDGGRTWINANRVFVRYNALADLLESAPRSNGQRGVDFVGSVLCGQHFQDSGAIVDYLVRYCLPRPLSAAKRQALVEFLGPLPPYPEWESRRAEVNARLTAAVVMLMSSPEYQLT